MEDNIFGNNGQLGLLDEQSIGNERSVECNRRLPDGRTRLPGLNVEDWNYRAPRETRGHYPVGNEYTAESKF